MAIPRLSVKPRLSRGKGRSAVAAAAYNGRERLIDQQTGRSWNYSRKTDDLLFSGIYLPPAAPAVFHDRATLWNAVLEREKHPRALTALPIEFALPHELTVEQNRRLLQDWVRENVIRHGRGADVAIHKPDGRGDQRNFHAHVLITERKLDATTADGWAKTKERHWTTPKERDQFYREELHRFRGSWEKLVNRHLQRAGYDQRISMDTLAEQGIDREPGQHLGVRATAMQRRGQHPERAARHHADRQQYTTNRRDLAETLRELQDLQRGQPQGAIRPEQDTPPPVTPEDDLARRRDEERRAAEEAAYWELVRQQEEQRQARDRRR